MSDVKKSPIRMTSLNGQWFTNGLHAAGFSTLFLILCYLYPFTRVKTRRLKLSVSVGQQRKGRKKAGFYRGRSSNSSDRGSIEKALRPDIG